MASNLAAGPQPPLGLDYRTAFDLAPVGLVLSRRRLVIDCNRELLAMFRARRDEVVGRSFEVLYPSAAEFERTGARIVASLDETGRYADERVMKRLDGELFWCHVSGRALDPAEPHAAGIWTFEDLSARRALREGVDEAADGQCASSRTLSAHHA